jgi:LPXTG-motif cell wall-anchored protein
MPMRTTAMPMRTAAIDPVKITVNTLVPQIIPAKAMTIKPATLKASSLAKKIKSITPVSMPIKAETVQTFKASMPIKSEVIKEQSNEIETAQEIQPKTDKPINKTLLIGGSIAAVAALYFLTKKRKK